MVALVHELGFVQENCQMFPLCVLVGDVTDAPPATYVPEFDTSVQVFHVAPYSVDTSVVPVFTGVPLP
jgi:hypothetical protein